VKIRTITTTKQVTDLETPKAACCPSMEKAICRGIPGTGGGRLGYHRISREDPFLLGVEGYTGDREMIFLPFLLCPWCAEPIEAEAIVLPGEGETK